MTGIETRAHDVLIIGAGGAGLRAAVACIEAGLSVGVVCKSLLGKAHTVMAEGGMAASLAHVDDRDGWTTHFRDTMVGGYRLNNPRMAELHAKEAPDRVRELEEWGAVFGIVGIDVIHFQDIMAFQGVAHALEPRDDVRGGVAFRMAHMQAGAAGIRKQ